MSGLYRQLRSIPKWTKIGVVGVLLIYTALAGTLSTALPWWIGKGDSALHLDYVHRLYHGEIPKYHAFVQYEPFHQLDPKYKTQINRAGANPPLFYLLHAPIVGPIMDSGNWKLAVAVGRTLNVFIGVLAMLALAWTGWLYGGKRKALMAVAVPAVASASFQITSLNQNYALDILLILLGVLTSVVWYKLLHRGLTKQYVFWLFVLSLLGMATKATYIVFLGISLLVVMVTAFLTDKRGRAKKILSSTFICGALLVFVIIGIGWFYFYWNYKTSGKWYTGELPGDFKSRPYKSLPRVLLSHALYANFYRNLTSYPLLSTVMTILSSVGIALAATRLKWRRLKKDNPDLLSFGVLLLLLGGTTLTQIAHAWGIGNFSFRYFLPAIPVYCLFVAYGLLEFKRTRGQFFTLAIAAMVVTSLITTANLENIDAWVPKVGTTDNIIQKLQIAVTSNGFAEMIVMLLLGLLAIGILATAVALFKLSKPSTRRA